MNDLRLKFLCIFSFLFSIHLGYSQEYLRMIDAGTYTVDEIISNAEAYFANRDKGRGTGYKPYKRWEYNALRMVKEDGYLPRVEERLGELQRWNAAMNENAANRVVLPDSWEDLGPSSWNATSGWNPGVGRITGLSFENGNDNHIIIGANTGGVWRTTDGAQTWTHLTDYFSHLSVYSVAIDPTNANNYFFGSVEGKIFKSTDSGATWNLMGSAGNSIINKIVINPNNTNMIFATSENSGIYRSVNGGTSWVKVVSDNNGYDVEFKPGDLSVVYASGSGFHKSTDGGETFTTISGFSNGPKMIGVTPDDAELVYVLEAAGSRFGGLYTSENEGNNFTKLNHGNLNFFGYSTIGEDNNGQAPRDMAIAVNPTNANEVHIAGILTWRSMDRGVNFTITSDWIPANAANANIGYCHADVDDLVFNGTSLYAVTDGGVFRAGNTGTISANYFEDLTTGLSIRQFYKIGVSQTQEVIISGGSQDNGTSFYKETTGWKDWLGADGMETFIDKTNSNMFFGTSQFGTLYRSTNGGNSYFGINSPGNGSGNWVTPFEQDPVQPNTIYVGYNRVYKSANNGITWNSISQVFTNNLDNLKIAPSNNQIMYANVGLELYRTENGGSSEWTRVTTPGGRINFIAIHPTNPNKIAVATTIYQRVQVSEDGGQTWTSYRKNLPNFSALCLVWDDNGQDGLYLGMDYGIYYIDNTFTDWQPYSNMLPNVMINELEINQQTRMLYAGTYGRGLWASPLVEETVGIEEMVFNNKVGIYPNPASSEVVITSPISTEGSIKVFDITGKLLIYEHNVVLSNTFTLDISSLPIGVYFIRLNTSEGMATKKLLKK
ncbi:T9SS type A sorting domain-containing protein [Aequorivita sp. H23M31]|uniref:T9SS type A sorting domain-containing protein n=1 Tax=Aequorivita ciconiae TaxID=2494375 RepID=A0A410G1M4_9FLAO|nr:T9SS type A sorting domain-containing protein [Aequorivita sp. H23M31]QAA81174.1 T9SS type A sorting domain-containing protein [Aequorivita sp. H23M31]